MFIKKVLVFTLTYLTLSNSVYGAYYAQSNNVVNIVNKSTNLCLVYNALDSVVRLSNCVKDNKQQQWIVPKVGNHYYVSRYDPNVCLYIKSSGTVMTTYCSTNKTKMGNIKYSYGGEAIWHVDNDNVCLGIADESASMVNDESIRKKNKIKVLMKTCNVRKEDQHWRLDVISENYGSSSTTKKTTTTTKKTTTTTKKTTTTTTKKTSTTTKTTTTVKTTTSTKKTTTSSAASTSVSFKYSAEKMVETDQELSNPYIGWYHGSHTIDLTDNPDQDCNYIGKFNSIRSYKSGLQYVGVRLGEYRDRSISAEGIAALENYLNEFQKRKSFDPTTQVILRFYYDGNENCKADKYGNPILKDGSSASDTSNEEGSFSQLDNDESKLTMDAFDYISNTYDPEISSNLEFVDAANVSDDESDIIYTMVDENSDSVTQNPNVNDDDDDNVVIINEDKQNSNLTSRASSQFNPAREVIEKKFYTCIEYDSQNNCKKYGDVKKKCYSKVDYHKVNCVKYTTNEVEPDSIDIIIKHIKQLAPTVNKFKDLIFIYQGSFLGTWGEMHSSDLITLDNLVKIMDALNTYFDSSIFLGVRTPKYHRGILYEMKKKDSTKYQQISNRLGLYNDGMFHDAKDYGTYGSDDINTNNGYVKAKREQELNYQNQVCLLAPNGGEGVYNENDEEDKNTNLKSQSAVTSLLKNPVYYCNFYVSDYHAKTIHLTYLNDEYHKDLMKKWSVTKGENIYVDNWNVDGKTYISNHMGYRYVLRNSVLQDDNTLSITVENVGYAPAYVKFDVKVYLYTTTPQKEKISIYPNTNNKKMGLK